MEPNEKQQPLVSQSGQSLEKRLTSDPRLRHLKMVSQEELLSMSDIALNDEVMLIIWQFMGNTYGQKWINEYGEFCENGKLGSAVNLWAQMLSRIPLIRIQRGLAKCVSERKSPFPPTLPEFFQLCAKEPWE